MDWTANNTLPRRERLTLECIAAGMSDKEMAREFNVSIDTIKNAVSNMYYKFGFPMGKGKRALLVAEAIKRGILTRSSLILVFGLCAAMLTGPEMQARTTRTPTRTAASYRTHRRGREDLMQLPTAVNLSAALAA